MNGGNEKAADASVMRMSARAGQVDEPADNLLGRSTGFG